MTFARISQGVPVTARTLLTEKSPPYLVSSCLSGTCRVCGGVIDACTDHFVRPYSLERAHASCGWFRENERHSVPGNCHELTTCDECERPAYVVHPRPGPWPEGPARLLCLTCRLAIADRVRSGAA